MPSGPHLHDVCCASLAGCVCRMLHGSWSVFRVRACILSPSAVIVDPPGAHCSGMRRLGRRRQTKQRSSRRRSARRHHLPSSHAIDALAYCTGHARPLEPLPRRSCTLARTCQLCGTHQGAYGWVGYNGVIPPHCACSREHDVTACTACGRVRLYVNPAAHSASVAHVHMYQCASCGTTLSKQHRVNP